MLPHGFLCFLANSMVRSDPPVTSLARVKTTAPLGHQVTGDGRWVCGFALNQSESNLKLKLSFSSSRKGLLNRFLTSNEPVGQHRKRIRKILLKFFFVPEIIGTENRKRLLKDPATIWVVEAQFKSRREGFDCD